MERLTSLHITRVHILSIQIIHNSFRLKNTFNRRLSIKLTITTPFLASPLFLQNIPKSDNSPNFWTEPCPPPPFQQTSRFANLPLDFQSNNKFPSSNEGLTDGVGSIPFVDFFKIKVFCLVIIKCLFLWVGNPVG